MSSPSSRSLTAAARLRAALDATATALARPDLDGLLAAESELTDLFSELSFLRSTYAAGVGATHASPLPGDDVDAVRDELLAAQAALLRARRLGASLGDFVRLSFHARGQATGYDPAGVAAATMTGRGLQVRA
jgi:hypothetical protein